MGFFGKKKDEAKNPEKPEKPAKAAKAPKTSKKEPVTQIGVGEEDGPKIQLMAMVLEQTQRKRAMSMLSISLLGNLVLLVLCGVIFWWGVVYKRDIYFMTTPDGRLQEMVPLTVPYISSAGVANWTAQAVTQTYTLDFRNWRQTLAKVRHYYSPRAWEQLDSEIRPLIDQIVNERLMIVAVADEAPRILAQGLWNKSQYVWKMEFPMTLTHQTGKGARTFKWTVTAVVGRAVVAEKSDGVEILQFIITPRRS